MSTRWSVAIGWSMLRSWGGDAGGMAMGKVRCGVTWVARRGHRLPAVVVVDAKEGAGEGHHLAVSNEHAGVNLPRWGGDEGCAEECDAEEAEQGGDDELERRLGFIWLHGLRG